MKGAVSSRSGFTLVEVLLALTISVMVFFAMGRLLVGTLRLWGDGAGEWYLASRARAARARLVSGGMGPGTGVLSIDEIKSIKTNPQWCIMEYQVAAQDEKYWIRGSVLNDAPDKRSISIKNNHGGGQTWLMMTGIKRGAHDIPDVKADGFSATLSNNILRLQYTLSCEIGGRAHEMPQVIEAYLVNE